MEAITLGKISSVITRQDEEVLVRENFLRGRGPRKDQRKRCDHDTQRNQCPPHYPQGRASSGQLSESAYTLPNRELPRSHFPSLDYDSPAAESEQPTHNVQREVP